MIEKLLKFVLELAGVENYRQKEIIIPIREATQRWFKALKKISIAFLAGFFFAFVWITNIGLATDQWLIRQLFSLRGPIPPPSEIVLIGIDDESFRDLGESPRWPLPRKHFATALEQIVAADPKVVILDLTAITEAHDPEANRRIEEALQHGRVTLGKGWATRDQQGQVEEYVMLADPLLAAAASMTLEMFLRSDRGIIWGMGRYHEGIAASVEDRFPLYPALEKLGGFSLTPPRGQDLVNFYGPAGSIPRIRFSELVLSDSEELRASLKDKVVFVGFQSMARKRGHIYQEEFPVSVSSTPMYGVEIHAHIAGNLIDQSWIKRFPRPIEAMMLMFFFSIIVLLTLATSIALSWWISVAAVVAWLVVTLSVFFSFSFFLPGGAFLGLSTVLFLGPISLLRALMAKSELTLFKRKLGIDDKN